MRFNEFFTEATDIEQDPAVKFYRMMSNPFDALTSTDAEPSTANNTNNDVPSQNFQTKKGAIAANQVSSYLASKGLDRIHILGILANIQGESGFAPGVLGDLKRGKYTSGGLFQHNGPRFKNMVNAVGSDWQTDWKGQIDFALSEPAGAKYIRTSFRTPQAATEWWTRNFEVPKYADADVQKRIGFLSHFA